MAKRPTALPLFATSAAAGAIVEPAEVVRTGGFSTNERPPAQWINWLHHVSGGWIDFLRGPSISNWTTASMTALNGGDPIVGAVDTDTAEDAFPIRRLVLAGTVAGPNPALRVSTRGTTWSNRTPTAGGPAIGEIQAIAFKRGPSPRWFLGTDDAGTGKIWYCAPSDGDVGSPIDDDSIAWTAATIPAAGAVLGFAIQDNNNLAAFRASTIIYSTDAGGTWANATLSGAPGGVFKDICWTGSAFIAVTDTGEIYTASSVTGTWTEHATNMGADEWRCSADELGNVLNYTYNAPATTDWYYSDDHGVTWNTVAAPAGFVDTGGAIVVRSVENIWLMACAQAPGLASANAIDDPAEWVRCPLPVTEPYVAGDLNFAGILFCEGAVTLFQAAKTFTSARANDATAGPFAPAVGPATLTDAAYLRGRYIDEVAPNNNQTLVYESATSKWMPKNGGQLFLRYEYKESDGATYTVPEDAAMVGVTRTSAGKTITLPAAAAGRRVEIVDEAADAAADNITIQPAAGTINGGASVTIAVNYGRRVCHSDGTNWFASTTH